MMFCPKCKSIMMPKTEKSGVMMVCSCGHKTKKEEGVALRETVKHKGPIPIVEKEPQILPKTDVICPKCKHKEAFWWEQQIRSADEPGTRFYKCVECEHVWRDLKGG